MAEEILTLKVSKLPAVIWPDRLVECVPNFSEARDPAVVSEIVQAAAGVPGIMILDLQRDIDHNRSVLTFVGAPDAVAVAAVAAAGVAARRIDLNLHLGVHPYIGSADVVPFIPLRGITLEQCAVLARAAGEQHWKQNGVPVYFYEAAALRHNRTRLEQIRKGGFRVLQLEAPSSPARQPDVGGPALHPTAGASVFGARKFLVAYNVNLRSSDVALAHKIARKIRASSGGHPCVKAIGVYLESRNLAQVSTNLTDFDVTPLHVVFQAIRDEAARAGVEVQGSELIGLIPRRALEMAGSTDFCWEHWDDSRVLETRIEMAHAGRLRWPAILD